MIGKIEVKGGLYRILNSRPRIENEEFAGKVEVLTIDELHRRMGHIAPEAAKQLVMKGLVHGIRLDESSSSSICESCEVAKMTRKAIKKVRQEPRAAAIGDEIHSDIWGPSPVETNHGKRYYISFTDDHSRFTHLYLIRKKDEAFESYVTYEAWLKNQKSAMIKCLHSDRGGEFISNEFNAHLAKHGTIRKLSAHDTPEYNGVSERLNRTLLEKVRAMLDESGLPKNLGEKQLIMQFT